MYACYYVYYHMYCLSSSSDVYANIDTVDGKLFCVVVNTHYVYHSSEKVIIKSLVDGVK